MVIVTLDMLEQFLNHIVANRLISSPGKVLLAVSGGVDSMVMLHLFSEAGIDAGVAHCNFQLRGDESDADEELVKQTCEKFGMPFFSKRFDVDEYKNQNGGSTQMAARDLRYQWFEELLEIERFDSIATAHHLDDSLETILLNLTKGTGFDGLSGIRVKYGKIIRPMLFATRRQIIAYAESKGITWRDDSSNASDKYQRNFIRNHIVPLIRQLNPGLDDTFAETYQRLALSWRFFQDALKGVRDKLVKNQGDRIVINKIELLKFEASSLILWELIKDCGFNFDQCKDIIAPHQSGSIFRSSTYQLVVDREEFILTKRSHHEKLLQYIQEENDFIKTTNGSVYITKSSAPDRINTSPGIAQLDAEKVSFPLTWRSWEHGDVFHPLGLGHSKKISDFLIDAKISVTDKERVTVITDSTGSIVWLVGYRIDDRFKISETTQMILQLEYTGL